MRRTRGTRRTAAIVASTVVLAAALGACSHDSDSGMHDNGMMDDGMMGGSSHHGANSPAFKGARTIEVAARSFAFAPARIEVQAGEPVNIRLTSKDVLHDFTVGDQDVHVVAKAGSTATGGMRLTEAGTYQFWCTVSGHRAAGMQGTIVVTEP